ncbi:hypothetical protein HYY70_06985 [Candidatus Woesearchaeota archaeon]|nr:hypothetical protein [Candidatus Woesearchaeota archaeon]
MRVAVYYNNKDVRIEEKPIPEINLKDMIAHKLKFDEIQEGFRLVAEAKDSLKVIVEPNR